MKDLPTFLQTVPAQYTPSYFWSWNAELSEELLLSQLHDMYDHGCRSVCIHPLPREFSPKSRMELSVDYLSDRYFSYVKRIADECKALGIKYILYDEGGWPSGGAAGRVFQCDPEHFARKVIRKRTVGFVPPEYTVPEGIVCAATIYENKTESVYRPGEKVVLKKGGTLEEIYVDPNGSDYPETGPRGPDLFRPDAVECFLETTHEKYKKFIGTHFGSTVSMVFTDEPAVTYTDPSGKNFSRDHVWQMTWTDSLPEVFRERCGYDLIPYLPSLQEDRLTPELSRVMVDFYDTWSFLFHNTFSRKIREWCHRNHVKFSGHWAGEDRPVCNAMTGFGGILRAMRALDIPGIDAIWRQIFPSNPNPVLFPKYASSVAAQRDKETPVLSESYMAYGAGLTPAQMKWVLDQQLVNGVNHFVFGHYPVSADRQFMAFCRPFFGGKNPLWKHLKPFHDYVSRLSFLLSRGRTECETAVYYPIRDIWAWGPHQSEIIAEHEELGAYLLQHQVSFDYIDDDVMLPENIHDGALKLGRAVYRRIMIPPKTEYLSDSAKNFLAAFQKAGGIVSDELPSPLVKTSVPLPDLRVLKKISSDSVVYFLVNSAEKEVAADFFFPESGSTVEYDACSNRLFSCDPRTLNFGPWESKVVIFQDDMPNAAPEDARTCDSVRTLSENWELSVKRRYVCRDEGICLETPEPAFHPSGPGPWKTALGDDFSGDVVYRIPFTVIDNAETVSLSLGRFDYAASVTLNGKHEGEILFPGQSLEIHPQSGQNILEVEVSNTLANTLLREGIEKRWHELWPDLRFGYDEKQRIFERDSLSGGLFGPVQLKIPERCGIREK